MSIRFQADNDLKFGIVKAVRRREPSMNFFSAQEAGLDGVGDPELLDRVRWRGASWSRMTAVRCSITADTA